MSFFKALRVTILLVVLVIVVVGQWVTRSRLSSWEKPVWITIYPIITMAQGTPGSEKLLAYVEDLDKNSFAEISKFFTLQGSRYGKQLTTPLQWQIAAPAFAAPPVVPPEGKRIQIAIWSLKMRWWAWRRERGDRLPGADIQMFVLYHGVEHPYLPERSVGVQKGMYGIVNAFASRGHAPGNRFVIAHELLHILGASDKYDPFTGQPFESSGLANPALRPLYPQKAAEIMAGRIALSRTRAVAPASLGNCLIGPVTAGEIGWN